MVKKEFEKLQTTVVKSVNSTGIINYLLNYLHGERVLSERDKRRLQQKNEPQQRCRDLLQLLFSSENPQAFVQLYLAMEKDPHLHWLTVCIDWYATGKCDSEMLYY